ncbi:histone-lysine N-methyltransferase, H3 lysine-9 specific SUVH6 [Eucalyptus grandis]|nr:histone-lysine N-methyltransferase, H3 lysine-9 specific SUVH6 [Eucalyptus grandis]
MSHKTMELSEKAMPRNVYSLRTIFPASRCSSSYTYILRYQSHSVGSTSKLKQDHSRMMEHVEDKNETESIKEGEFISDKPPNASVKNSMNADGVILQGQSPFDWSKSNILIKNMTEDSCQIIIKEAEKRVQCSRVPYHEGKGFKRKCLGRSDIEIAKSSFSELRSANVTRNDRHDLARERVIATLRLYRDICHELDREKSKAHKDSTCIRRIDFHAAKEVKKRAGYVHGAWQFLGDVPGVEVGDKFHYRMELAIVGLHRPPQSGIDYMGPHPNILATSVVASWDYADDLTNSDELVYLGQGGGMPSRNKKAEDQKLTRGNLALVNSMKRNKPVRVIRKDWDDNFTYDGLYVVDRLRKVSRANGKMVFEFIMKRLPGQAEIRRR